MVGKLGPPLLSSGKRINSASDDAAGVAIASRLTSEVRGTKQAIRNAMDGQALVDAAEGGLQETEVLLQRMRELAVQSATDTNSSVDRANLNTEYQALNTEIERIMSQTSWAGQSLLDGTGGSNGVFIFQVGASSSTSISSNLANSLSTSSQSVAAEGITSSTSTLDSNNWFATIFDFSGPVSTGMKVTYDLVADTSVTASSMGWTAPYGTRPDAHGSVVPISEMGTGSFTLVVDETGNITGITDIENVDYWTDTPIFGSAANYGTQALYKESNVASSVYGPKKIAMFSGSSNLGFAVSNISVTETKDATDISASSISSRSNSNLAITTADAAIKSINTQRSNLGAVSNRLSNTVNNLTNISVNLSVSKGAIEDADFAVESTNLAKNQILQQAAIAMLAQANASKQDVLSLLQN